MVTCAVSGVRREGGWGPPQSRRGEGGRGADVETRLYFRYFREKRVAAGLPQILPQQLRYTLQRRRDFSSDTCNSLELFSVALTQTIKFPIEFLGGT